MTESLIALSNAVTLNKAGARYAATSAMPSPRRKPSRNASPRSQAIGTARISRSYSSMKGEQNGIHAAIAAISALPDAHSGRPHHQRTHQHEHGRDAHHCLSRVGQRQRPIMQTYRAENRHQKLQVCRHRRFHPIVARYLHVGDEGRPNIQTESQCRRGHQDQHGRRSEGECPPPPRYCERQRHDDA